MLYLVYEVGNIVVYRADSLYDAYICIGHYFMIAGLVGMALLLVYLIDKERKNLNVQPKCK